MSSRLTRSSSWTGTQIPFCTSSDTMVVNGAGCEQLASFQNWGCAMSKRWPGRRTTG